MSQLKIVSSKKQVMTNNFMFCIQKY